MLPLLFNRLDMKPAEFGEGAELGNLFEEGSTDWLT